MGYKNHIFWLQYVEADRKVKWLEVVDEPGLAEGLLLCNSATRMKHFFDLLKGNYEKAGLDLPKVVMVHSAYDELNRHEVILGWDPLN